MLDYIDVIRLDYIDVIRLDYIILYNNVRAKRKLNFSFAERKLFSNFALER